MTTNGGNNSAYKTTFSASRRHYYLNQNSNAQKFIKEGRRLNLTYLSIRRKW